MELQSDVALFPMTAKPREARWQASVATSFFVTTLFSFPHCLVPVVLPPSITNVPFMEWCHQSLPLIRNALIISHFSQCPIPLRRRTDLSQSRSSDYLKSFISMHTPAKDLTKRTWNATDAELFSCSNWMEHHQRWSNIGGGEKCKKTLEKLERQKANKLEIKRAEVALTRPLEMPLAVCLSSLLISVISDILQYHNDMYIIKPIAPSQHDSHIEATLVWMANQRGGNGHFPYFLRHQQRRLECRRTQKHFVHRQNRSENHDDKKSWLRPGLMAPLHKRYISNWWGQDYWH